MPPPARPSRHAVPDDTAEAWESVVLSLLSLRGNPVPPSIVFPTQEARSVLDALANKSADNQEEDGEWNWCRPFAARLAENAWRLALVFHAVLHPENAAAHPLEEKTATAAVETVRWFFAETLVLLSPVRSQQTAVRMDKLAMIFRDRHTNTLPLRKLNQNHGFKEPEMRALAEEFPHRLKIVTLMTGGRPSTVAQFLR